MGGQGLKSRWEENSGWGDSELGGGDSELGWGDSEPGDGTQSRQGDLGAGG